MKFLGNYFTDVSRFRNDVYIESYGPDTAAGTSSHLYVYSTNSEGNPTISLGSNAEEAFRIQAVYDTEATTLDKVIIRTTAASGTGDKGAMFFQVDEVAILSILDDGINLATSSNFSIGSVDIIDDNSGTTTLKNIDALDATTISTFNSALTAGDITSVTAGTNLSGGGHTGDVTINLDTASTSTLGAASFSSSHFDVDSGAVSIKAGGIGIDRLSADVLVLESERIANNDNDETIPTCAAVQDAVTNTTSVGTISTGTWQGTAIATGYTKHLVHYRFIGYGTGDGTNYFAPQPLSDNQAPFEHADSSSADGLTIPAASGTNISELLRGGGHVMTTAVTLKRWTGWASCNGSAATKIGLFKWTPVDNNSSNVSPVLLDEATITAAGNDKARSFAETSFTQASVAAGDIIFTQVFTAASKTVFFNSTLEVEF
tara:strand:- start:880 stop:2172 length:1293 start_codon:yes stop_codon:yes gene_type:complete